MVAGKKHPKHKTTYAIYLLRFCLGTNGGKNRGSLANPGSSGKHGQQLLYQRYSFVLM